MRVTIFQKKSSTLYLCRSPKLLLTIPPAISVTLTILLSSDMVDSNVNAIIDAVRLSGRVVRGCKEDGEKGW